MLLTLLTYPWCSFPSIWRLVIEGNKSHFTHFHLYFPFLSSLYVTILQHLLISRQHIYFLNQVLYLLSHDNLKTVLVNWALLLVVFCLNCKEDILEKLFYLNKINNPFFFIWKVIILIEWNTIIYLYYIIE